MKPRNLPRLATVATAALLLSLLAARWHVSQNRSEQLVAKPPESVMDDLVNHHIRSEYGDRAALIQALQATGITFESYRQQVKQQVEAGASRR
jgi:hypothetical protein